MVSLHVPLRRGERFNKRRSGITFACDLELGFCFQAVNVVIPSKVNASDYALIMTKLTALSVFLITSVPLQLGPMALVSSTLRSRLASRRLRHAALFHASRRGHGQYRFPDGTICTVGVPLVPERPGVRGVLQYDPSHRD